MPSFIYRLQKRLSESGTIHKFLLYVFGEIILVVIGILIAVQINSWYQSQKEIDEEKVMISRILEELEDDKDRLVNVDSIYAQNIPDLERIFFLIDKKNDIDDVNEITKNYHTRIDELKASKVTFEEMKNTGRIYRLSNSNQNDALISYYSNFEEQQHETKQDRVELGTFFFDHSNYAFWSWVQKLRKKQVISSQLYEWINDPNSLEWKYFEISIGFYQSTLRKHRFIIEELLSSNKTLSDLIKSELKEAD